MDHARSLASAKFPPLSCTANVRYWTVKFEPVCNKPQHPGNYPSKNVHYRHLRGEEGGVIHTVLRSAVHKTKSEEENASPSFVPLAIVVA